MKNTFTFQDNRGQTMMLSIIFFLFISLTIVLGIVSPVLKQFGNSNKILSSKSSYYLAESGVEDAFYRIKTAKQISASETLVLGSSTATTTITDLGNNTKQITTLGDTSNFERKIDAVVETGDGVSFSYGVQVGQGGLDLSGSSWISGNVYANGPITSDSSSWITGSAVSANSASLSADQSNGAGTTPPTNTIIFGNNNATQDVAQSFQLSAEAPINKISLYITRTASAPSNATVRIALDNGGVPSSTYVATGTLTGSSPGTSFQNGVWTDVSFSSNPTLNVGQTYWIVIDASTNSSKYYTIGADTGYVNGGAKIGQYGSTWNNTSPSGLDFQFKVYLGGFTGSITGGGSQWNQVRIGTTSGTAQAHTVNYVNVTGALYCQSGSGNNKSCDTTQSDPAPQAMPVSDANIQDWKDAAVAGGTYSGNYSLGGSSTATLGPQKINGNLTVSNSGVLTINGTLWVTGNLSVSGSAIVKLASSYGATSDAIIVDGTVTISGSSPINGSGTSGSYILVLSTSDCPTSSSCSGSSAINISGAAGAVILYAENGTIAFSGSASAKEATGYRITLSGATNVTYQSGLINPNFTSGPSGTYSVDSWKEIQ